MTRVLPPAPAVDVWWFDVRTIGIGPAGIATLDDHERHRAEAFLFDTDRHRYRVAHVMLRRVLAAYQGTRPGELTFGREPCPRCGRACGRPVLAAGGPWFSLSHSGDVVLIAVARRPVGADVERAPAGCVCSLAGALHPDDAGVLARMPERARHEAVITCWVRAEAVLKCSGEGIAHGLGEFPVWPAATGTAAGPGGAVRELPAPPGYQAAIAVAGTSAITPRAVAGLSAAPQVPGILDPDAEV